MNVQASTPDDADLQLDERLAEFIETLDRGGSIDEETACVQDPVVAERVREYLDAVAVVDRVSAPLRSLAGTHRPLQFPQLLGDYELLAEVGCGGTAIVYRARQRGLNRLVAVKMLRGGRPGSLYDVERMRFEAEAVAQLEHPGIVPIYEIGEREGRQFFSMKLYDGGSLATRLDSYAERPRDAAELVAAVAQAVHHAHQRGILHRDLKPSNVLLDAAGRPHVADFGLAKRLQADQELTQTGELIGTPAYIAPERIGGSAWSGPATVATDVYGLGAVLYALLSGRPPFQEESSIQTLLAVSTDEPVLPTHLNSRVDQDLQIICLKCLEKDPKRRYRSALDLSDDLQCWLAGDPISARPLGRIERFRRWCRRHPLRATVSAAALVLGMTGVVGLTAGYLLISRANRTAEGHRIRAEENAAALSRRLYVSQMALGHKHLERGELGELRNVLDEFRKPSDVVTFEWRWLDENARTMPREMTCLTGHEHIVYGGVFSPDGRTVATCGADATIRLWEAATGKVRQVLNCGDALSPLGEKYDENCVCFSPDGSRIASVCESGAVRVWSVSDGLMRQLHPASAAETLSVEFSPDGEWLVTASVDGVVRVWDVNRLERVQEFRGHDIAAKWATFSPDDRELASVDQDGNVLVRERVSGHVRLRFNTGTRSFCLAWSPDGTLIATEGGQDTVCLWDASTGNRVAAFPAHWGIRSLAFSPDSTRLASAGNDGCVRIWSIADGKLRTFFQAHRETVWSLQFARDGARILTCSGDRTARVWDLTVASVPDPTLDFSHPVRKLAFSSDGRSLALLTSEGEVWTGSATVPADWSKLPIAIRANVPPVFSPDGNEMACIGSAGEILRWSCKEQRLFATYQPPAPVIGDLDWKLGATLLAYLPDGRLAALSSRGWLAVCSAGNWTNLRPVRDGLGHARLLVPMNSGRTLALCDLQPEQVDFWDVDCGECDRQISFGAKLETGALSPDEQWLASARGDGTIELLDLRAAGRRAALVGHRAVVTSLAFSRDSRTLVSGSEDGSVRLWNVQAGLELFVLEQRSRPVFSVAISPDGNQIAVGGEPRDDGSTLSIHRAKPSS